MPAMDSPEGNCDAHASLSADQIPSRPVQPCTSSHSLGSGVGSVLPGGGPHRLSILCGAPGGQRGVACQAGGGGQLEQGHVPCVVVLGLLEPTPRLTIHCEGVRGGQRVQATSKEGGASAEHCSPAAGVVGKC